MILKEIIAGTHMAIARAGIEVGSGPVNIVGPDFFPAANSGVWESLGDCPNGILEPTYKDLSPRMKHLASGRSWLRRRRRLTNADVKFQSHDMNEPAVRLAFAVGQEIVDGTPVSPLSDSDPKLECWLNWQNRNDDGVDVSKLALYGWLRLDTNPQWGNIEFTEPAWIFEVHPTSIQSLVTLGLLPSEA